MATHSSILAWRIPWTAEPGGLQSVESQSDTTEQLNHNQNRYLYQAGANGVEGRVRGVSSERHTKKRLMDSPADPLWEEWEHTLPRPRWSACL